MSFPSIIRNSQLALRKWDSFWMAEAPPHAIAIFRIAFGAWLLLYWSRFAPFINLMFSNDGVVVPLFAWYPVPSIAMAWVLYILLLLCVLGILLGFCFRAASILAFVIQLHLWFLSLQNFGTSFDLLYLFLILTMAISRADATLSLRMLLEKGSIFAWESVSIFAQRLIQFQITMTYTGVGWQKLWLSGWQGGEVLSMSFIGVWATPIAFWLTRHINSMLFFDALVFAVKVLEIMLPIGLWIKPLQKYAFMMGIVFHVLLVAFLGMWWFLPMIVTYLLFLRPDSVKNWIEKKRASGFLLSFVYPDKRK